MACLEIMLATTKAMEEVHFLRHLLLSALCTSTNQATTRGTQNPHPMRSLWIPLSLQAATHHRAPMPTSTMPTTPPCAASPAHQAIQALSAQWKVTVPRYHLLHGSKNPHGSLAAEGKGHQQ